MVGSDGLNGSPSALLEPKQPPKQWGVTRPLSHAGPTEADIQRNRGLEKFLVDSGLFESAEEASKRETVLGRLKQKDVEVQHLYLGRAPPMFTEIRVLRQTNDDGHLQKRSVWFFSKILVEKGSASPPEVLSHNLSGPLKQVGVVQKNGSRRPHVCSSSQK